MKSVLVWVGVVAALVVSSAAWAVTQGPDYVWRRPAFYEPFVGRFASANGMVGVADRGSCYVVRASDGFVLKTFAINGVNCAGGSFSPDGRLFALSGTAVMGSLRVYVYETAGWTQVAFFTAPFEGETIFSPDGRYLLMPGSTFTGTPVYDVATWTHQRTLPGEAASVSPDSQLVAVSSRTGIHLFRLEDGTEVTPPSGYPQAAGYLLGNDWIALAANDEIRIETLTEPPQVIATLSAPQIFLRLAISPDGQTLAGIVVDGKGGRLLQLWETKGFSSLRSWTISPNNDAAVAFASNDSIVSSNSTSDDARVDLWRVSDGTLLQPLNTDKGIYTAMVYSLDGSAVVGGFGPNGNIRAWRASDGTPLQMISGSGRLTSLSFTQDGQYLVGGGDRVSVWSWPDGDLVQSVSESAQDVAVSTRGVLAQRTANEIRLRTLPDLMPLRTISQGGPISFSPDGNLIMVDAGLFEVDTGARVRTFPNGPFRNSVFSPDGMNVVVSRGGRLDRFDVTSGDLVAEFGLMEASYIVSLSFSPDGTRLAAFSGWSTFRSGILNLDIWDGYGSLYQDYNDDLGLNGGRANYSPDGRYLAVTVDDFNGFFEKTFGVAVDPCADGGCL